MSYIRNPLAQNPQAQMPGNKDYDNATSSRARCLLPTTFPAQAQFHDIADNPEMLLVFGVAIFYSLVVFNNVADYGSNYQFVRHVLMMDTTFPGNQGMWRAINSPALHTALYVSIIAWEFLTMLLCWWGGVRMVQARNAEHAGVRSIQKASGHPGIDPRYAHVACGVSLPVGGEWFLMWQSKTWNGQDAAFRMFTVIGIVLLLVVQPDGQEQP